jgi:hypothetical protein
MQSSRVSSFAFLASSAARLISTTHDHCDARELSSGTPLNSVNPAPIADLCGLKDDFPWSTDLRETGE